MMRVRFFAHPERKPEWIMAIATLCWGLNAMIDMYRPVERHTMDSPFFAPLLSIGVPQLGWGFAAAVVGSSRIACLIVNGSRPRGSTLFRSIGAGLSAVFWFGLVIGAYALPYLSGAVFTYGALLAFDLASLWQASKEIAPAFERTRLAHGGR